MTRLQHGVAAKSGLGLVRFRQIQLSCGDNLVISIQQGRDFGDLSGVVSGRDEPHPFDKLEFHRCSRTALQSIAKV